MNICLDDRKKEEKLVSVIMPAYNEEKYIGEAIQSVLEQIYTNWELIIVDDGSKDRTPEIIRQYSEKELRIKPHWFSENRGACAALNEALRRAEGEFICWLSADDRYGKEMLWSSVNFLMEHKNYQAVFSRAESINEYSEKTGGADLADKYINVGKKGSVEPYYTMVTKGNAFGACSVLAKADVIRKAGFFDEKHPYAGDYHYMMKVAAYADFGFLNKLNLQSRIHSEQVTNEGKNEIDAIHAYADIVFSEGLRKSLYQKAGISDSREGVLETFQIRKKLYEYVGCAVEAETAEFERKRFLTEFPLVVQADRYCKEISECMNVNEWDKAAAMIQNASDEVIAFADKEMWGILKANILEYDGDYMNEKEMLKCVLMLNESNYEAHFMYGNICEKEEDWTGALERYMLSVRYSKHVKNDFEMLVQNLKRFLNQYF